jgi:hypothetical protein
VFQGRSRLSPASLLLFELVVIVVEGRILGARWSRGRWKAARGHERVALACSWCGIAVAVVFLCARRRRCCAGHVLERHVGFGKRGFVRMTWKRA